LIVNILSKQNTRKCTYDGLYLHTGRRTAVHHEDVWLLLSFVDFDARWPLSRGSQTTVTDSSLLHHLQRIKG